MSQKIQTSAVICAKAETASLFSVIAGAASRVDEVVVVLAPGDICDLKLLRKKHPKIAFKKILVCTDSGKGKGEAVRLGIERSHGEIIVLMDADGSHRIQDISKLIKPIISKQAEFVLASRGKGGSDELHGTVEKMIRLIGSSVITVIINLRFGVELTDSQNGFRAITRRAVDQLTLTTNSFAIEQEMLMQALKRKIVVAEVASHEYARISGQSRINLWEMTPKYAWVLFKNIW